MVSQNRRLSTHGGLITYVHEDFSYRELNADLPITLTSTLFESLFIELWRKNCTNQKYIVGNIYRLPLYLSDDVRSFTKEYTDVLNVLRTRSKPVYVCGDYDIDLLKIGSNNDYCSFYKNVLSSSFAPKITLPTRMCDTASTLIDNVFSNVIDKDHTCGVLVRPISDHQMYFCILNENYIKPITRRKFVEIEESSQEALARFKTEIANSEIYDKLRKDLSTDPNDNYKILSEVLEKAKNIHLPKKYKKFNKRKYRKESWMTNELLTKVVKKNELYVEWKTTEINDRNYEMIKLRFKNHEKDVLKDISNAKKNYFNRIFNAYKNDMKKTWRTINETLSRDKISSELPFIFYHNDLELINPAEIANAFNMHFANIG